MIEDAQWADSGTLSCCATSSSKPGPGRFCSCSTYRTADAAELPSSTPRGPPSAAVAGGHDPHARAARSIRTLALLQALLGEIVVLNELVKGIEQELEGNPLYIEEVRKGLVDFGPLARRDGDWHLVDRRGVPVPASLRVAVEERLRRLPAEAQQALEVVAVCGPVFEPAMIAGLIGVYRGRPADALAAAERAEIIRPLPDGADPGAALCHACLHCRRRGRAPGAAATPGAARRRRCGAGGGASGRSRSAGLPLPRGGDSRQGCRAPGARRRSAEALHACREAIESTRPPSISRGRPATPRAACTLLKLGLACSADFQFDAARLA